MGKRETTPRKAARHEYRRVQAAEATAAAGRATRGQAGSVCGRGRQGPGSRYCKVPRREEELVVSLRQQVESSVDWDGAALVLGGTRARGGCAESVGVSTRYWYDSDG